MVLVPIRQTLRRRWKLIVVSLSLLAVSGGIYFFLFSDTIGGMRPTYAAADGDARLTRHAKTALPVIAALRQYHGQHNGFPEDVAQLGPLLPAGAVNLASHSVEGWTYFSAPKSDTFELSLRLGWDPSLVYHGSAASGTWAFEPGDGSPEKPIVLDP